jgi:hypothetical protein
MPGTKRRRIERVADEYVVPNSKNFFPQDLTRAQKTGLAAAAIKQLLRKVHSKGLVKEGRPQAKFTNDSRGVVVITSVQGIEPDNRR